MQLISSDSNMLLLQYCDVLFQIKAEVLSRYIGILKENPCGFIEDRAKLREDVAALIVSKKVSSRT